MKTHVLQRTQFIPGDINDIWAFFSSPHNLAKITPKEMGFRIVGAINKEPIYSGMEIDYIVQPILSIPLSWKTRISDVNELKSFTDIQLKGPYALWEHKHSFVPVKNGVSMTDTVNYALPFGILGEFAHQAFVKKRLDYIFDYRTLQIDNYFKNHS
jgi:ligand-binding SRPBCC domain-containing protein